MSPSHLARSLYLCFALRAETREIHRLGAVFWPIGATCPWFYSLGRVKRETAAETVCAATTGDGELGALSRRVEGYMFGAHQFTVIVDPRLPSRDEGFTSL